LLPCNLNPLPETEIISLIGDSKSGDVCISHAGGGSATAYGGEAQLASASGNITLQIVKLAFRISELSTLVFVNGSNGNLCPVLPVNLLNLLAVSRL